MEDDDDDDNGGGGGDNIESSFIQDEHSLWRDLCNSGCYPRHRHHHENQVYYFSSSFGSPTLFSTILTIIVSRCGRRTEQTWRKDSSSESSFEISSKSPDLLVKDIQGGGRVDDETKNE